MGDMERPAYIDCVRTVPEELRRYIEELEQRLRWIPVADQYLRLTLQAMTPQERLKIFGSPTIEQDRE